MRVAWFRQWGWIYRPVAWQGWAASLVSLVFCAHVFVAVDRHSHSASDTLYGIFPYVVSALTLLNWMASKTAHKR
jgi:hypothetical protein